MAYWFPISFASPFIRLRWQLLTFFGFGLSIIQTCEYLLFSSGKNIGITTVTRNKIRLKLYILASVQGLFRYN